ncbi:MAG: ComEC/Rec2 family competence protein [Bacteroidales bacterium]|nr:ComEC/Rec2 family competence protein [Bacteroidales bacterium]
MSLPISIKEVPFFRLILPFIAGIACQYGLEIFSYSLWNYAFLLLLLGTVLTSFLLASNWMYRWVFGVTINTFIFFTGVILTIKQPASDKLLTNSNNRAIIYLLDNPQLRTKSIRAQVEVKYIQSNNSWWATNEKMLVYFSIGDSLAANLTYGSVLIAELNPQPIAQSGNPYQFDYKKYLSDRGVNYTAYLQPGKWELLENQGVGIKKSALFLRDKLVTLFKANGLSNNELAVASALTLGYQDLLDDELRQVYSSSGAMHILSVSGLHIGILYVLLSFLLTFLDKKVVTRAIKALILLAFLWFFSLLTGLPPCVQRSALMFSFLVIGDFFERKSNIYNTLAASAFVLLVINPYNLLDVGFQLSYLAVISIVYFYPYVYKIIYVKNWALEKVWSLIAVSIAAQLGTFSISLFYFSQFPNYFLLSNLVAIPLSTIALYLSVLLMIVSPIPVIAGFVGKIFSLTISLLNHSLEYIEKLPYSVSEGLHISALQMLSIFGIIFFLSIYLTSKRVKYIFASLILLLIFLGLRLNGYIDKSEAKELIVYNINKKSLVSLRANEKLMFIDIDTSSEQFSDKYNFYIKGYISAVGSDGYDVINPELKAKASNNDLFVKTTNHQGITIIAFCDKTIAIPFRPDLDKMVSNGRLDVDYLVINKYHPYRVLDFFKPRMVIIDSSVSKQALANITQRCKLDGTPFYITSSQGAFVLKSKKG